MRLSTGVDVLDRRLEGGIPPGALIALTARPDTQSELLLHEIAGERETVYVSPIAPPEEVRAFLEDGIGDAAGLSILDADPETMLDDPTVCTGALGREMNVIVDAANVLETADRSRYLSFLNAFKAALRETDSVGVLHCIESDRNPDHRSLTLMRADLVWRLSLAVTPLSIETRLLISKFRGGRALKEPIKLLLTDRVSVDTSRDIA